MTTSFFQDRTVLVTGGTGFIGSALARRLESCGARVFILSRSRAAGERAFSLDIADSDAVQRTFEAVRPSVVFHCAASLKPQGDADAMIQVNICGTRAVLSACSTVGPEAVVVAGSWTEYGSAVRSHVQEDDPAFPGSVYGVTKLASTLLVRAWSLETNVPATVLRLGSVYGPGEDASRLIPTLMASARTGIPAALSYPDTVRDFVHVDDVADAFLCAGERARTLGMIVNIASGVGTSVAALTERIRGCAPGFPEPTWGSGPTRPWDVPSWVADITRARVVLGWTPTRDLTSGLQELLNHAP